MTGYKDVITAKDGTKVPVFTSGQTMFSRYAPNRDAESFFLGESSTNQCFFVVCGIGNGKHLESLRERFPNSKIVGVESSAEDIIFLDKHFNITKMSTSLPFTICTTEELHKTLIDTYIPIMHGDFKLLSVRSWVDNNTLAMSKITTEVNEAILDITADMSTQAHFGRTWHRNIIQNLCLASRIAPSAKLPIPHEYKGAFVVAAGPSLDKAIAQLKDNHFRSEYYIIATDTALPVLIRSNIHPDATITIDGQAISHAHFMQRLPEKMLLAVDICAQPGVVRRVMESGGDILFFMNKHPLCDLISEFMKERCVPTLPHVSSGAGTVTIAAFDFALKLGFSEISVLGADFAYIEGKPYARGTYFQDLFSVVASRLAPIEQKYATLLYRSEAIRVSHDTQTTKTLEAYKQSLNEYIAQAQCIEKMDAPLPSTQTYIVMHQQKETNIDRFNPSPEDCKDFITWYTELLRTRSPTAIPSILPLAAWYKKKNPCKNDIFSFLKLAYSQTVRYTNIYGK